MGAPDLEDRYRVAPGTFPLADHDPADTAGLDRKRARKLLTASVERMQGLQSRLMAERRQSLLVVLQGVDASGKDGIVAHVMGGLNPAGIRVISFKQPSPPELAHDWLWRCVLALPEHGHIGVFNRSHYEDVIVPRVHPEKLAVQPAATPDARFWEARINTIEAWERHLVANGTRVVKFFLHISKEEQRERLLARAYTPEKRWKFSAGDVAERAYWDEYQRAYEHAVTATSTGAAPWYAIPADHKWMARAAVAHIVAHHFEDMDPRYPGPDEDTPGATAQAIAILESEG
jgi:PPK2 family polyphosphate:nucleotide phosphotransferase